MTLKRYGISIVERTRRCIAAATMLFIALSLSAQQNPYFTQHANNPLLINPAFAGGRNSLAVDIATRQQWVGVDGAPMTFMLNTHAPINETMMSVGASFYSDIAGPVMANHASLAYSYLLKINHSHFLSLGINGGINSYRVKLSDIKLNDGSDPNFASDIENEITPSFGAGLMLYSPLYYIGFSIPRILASEIEYPDAAGRQFRYANVCTCRYIICLQVQTLAYLIITVQSWPPCSGLKRVWRWFMILLHCTTMMGCLLQAGLSDRDMQPR